MYNSYFGFREKPFKLVPNPDYLFLSKSHEIALAHLTYATDEGDGFVVITGEVGTGKTTLCRNYLEGLDEQVSSAYIFNPRLESAQLLGSICAEFGIVTQATRVKTLLEVLNSYLIAQKSLGFKVVLLIDEAQGLSVENLELVRMLSNLETTRSKLLQIILVGQPELADTLDSYELRQLAQRISLNYHLSPLSAKETEAYIHHRLGVATKGQTALITPNACRAAFHYSGGIPRLINIVCDRALLLAFSNNHAKVTKALMQSGIRELLNRGGQAKRTSIPRWSYLVAASALAVVAIAVALFIWLSDRGHSVAPPSSLPLPEASAPSPPASTFKVGIPGDQAPAAPANDSMPAAASAPAVEPAPAPDLQPVVAPPTPAVAQVQADVQVQDSAQPPEAADGIAAAESRPAAIPIGDAIEALEPNTSRRQAVSTLLTIWQQPRPNPNLLPEELADDMFFDLAARQYGLRTYATQWNWDLIRRLDLPLILSIRKPGASRHVYLALVREDQGRFRLSQGEGAPAIDADMAALAPMVAGPVYVFWRNALGFDSLIGRGANRNAVLSVKHLLRQIGYEEVPLTSDFDAFTRDAVVAFQAANNLVTDGLVGPLTKIMLIREAGVYGMPHLMDKKRDDS